jgi:large subunit ribosomal protein L24
MAAKLKTGDKVVVLSGKDKGKEGEILSVDPKAGKAVVKGVNIAIRHQKQSQNSQGGRIPQAMPIDLSNLALIDPRQGGPTRVGFRMEEGKKVRFAKKRGT